MAFCNVQLWSPGLEGTPATFQGQLDHYPLIPLMQTSYVCLPSQVATCQNYQINLHRSGSAKNFWDLSRALQKFPESGSEGNSPAVHANQHTSSAGSLLGFWLYYILIFWTITEAEIWPEFLLKLQQLNLYQSERQFGMGRTATGGVEFWTMAFAKESILLLQHLILSLVGKIQESPTFY